METVLIELLPYIIGSAVVPIQVIISLLLLKSRSQGLLKAIAYVAGMTITRLLQGLLFGAVLVGTPHASNDKALIVPTLLLVLGILLLITAYKKWSGENDADAPPPRWLSAIDQVSPLKALGIGLGLPLIAAKLWVFTLSAIATISAANLGQPSSAILFLLFIVLAESLLIIPIMLRILIPKRSQSLLTQMSNWLERNNRSIVISVSLIFGLWFVYSGITGFLK